MKATRKSTSVLAASLIGFTLLWSAGVFGQRPGFRNNPLPADEKQPPLMGVTCPLPGLTEAQTESMRTLRLKTIKDTQPLRNQLEEKRARLRTLSTADNPDAKAINKTIDDMAALRADIQKIRAARLQEFRKLLTDEQRILFDARIANPKLINKASAKKPYYRNSSYCPGCPSKK